MRYPFALFLAILILPTAETASAQKTLAIVGSSTSACTGPTVYNNCYVVRLRNYYNQQVPNDTTIDNGYAVGGYNCYRGMPTGYVPPYTDPSFQPDPGHNITAALAAHPDVVLVNYPTNNYNTLPLDSILFCLRTIRNVANQAGVPCFVTTTQPRTDGGFNTPSVIAKLAELKDSILLEFGYFAIDFYTLLVNPDGSIRYDAGDGIHMNDVGHDSLYRRVLAKNVFLATLPATFLQFNTVYKNKTAVISWLTARETDVAYYEIQRSANGTAFSSIGRVSAVNTYGNNQYLFTDDQPLKGNNYYKIVIVDKDGKKHASPVMTLSTGAGNLAILKTFARSASQVVISLQNNEPQQVQLQLLNNLGTVISAASKNIGAGNSLIYFDTPLLSSGIYHVKLTTARETISSSFVKTF